MRGRHIGVIGGGVAGLVAARELDRRGARVTLFEGDRSIGGQVRTIDFAGCRVDVGAESLHGAAPAVSRLLVDLGLSGSVVPARPGRAWIWTARGLKQLPAGVGPGGPTRLAPVLRARVLSPAGLVRAALEPVLPRSFVEDDVAVGRYLAQRFGPQVRDRLVDPVLGSLHAGDVDALSLESAAPQLATLARRHRSLLLAHRARRQVHVPSFVTFGGGLQTLIDALVAGSGATVRCSTPIRSISPDASGYRLLAEAGTVEVVDGVVVALPAATAAGLVAPLAADAAGVLETLRSVSVATVLAAYPRRAAEGVPALSGSGLLVPSSLGRTLKAATFLSRKWTHLSTPEWFLVRLSAGRTGGPVVSELTDAELVEVLHRDLADATGLPTPPAMTHVERWPGAMAQHEVGHLARLATVRAGLARHPAVAVAGAAYDGVGISACIASGEKAADLVAAALAPTEAGVP